MIEKDETYNQIAKERLGELSDELFGGLFENNPQKNNE